MKCDICNTEWEGEGLCPNCNPAPAEETAPVEDTTAEPAATEESLPANTEAENTEEPIPLPVLAEGFESGVPGAQKQKKKGATVFLSILLTAAVLLAAFLAAGFFVKEWDVLRIFHPSYKKAEELAVSATQAFYKDVDLDAFFALTPESAREEYAARFLKNNGAESMEALEEEIKKAYETFEFGGISAETHYIYTDAATNAFLEGDMTSALFYSDIDPKNIDEVIVVNVKLEFTPEGGEMQIADLTHMFASVNGRWLLIQ